MGARVRSLLWGCTERVDEHEEQKDRADVYERDRHELARLRRGVIVVIVIIVVVTVVA